MLKIYVFEMLKIYVFEMFKKMSLSIYGETFNDMTKIKK